MSVSKVDDMKILICHVSDGHKFRHVQLSLQIADYIVTKY